MKEIKMKKGFVLRSNLRFGYYNGSSDDWGVVEVERPEYISSEYVFDSIEDVEEYQENFNRLRFLYDIVEIGTQPLKPPCQYPRGLNIKPSIKLGSENEICSYCGTNILAKEPYLIWKYNKKYCLHCVMDQLDNVNELFGSTPADLKEEWATTGKEKLIKCLDYILKNVDGSNS